MKEDKAKRDAPDERVFAIKYPIVKGAEELETIQTEWDSSRDENQSGDGLKFMFEKIREEYMEFIDGPDENPDINDGILKTTGDSRFSESVTVILTLLHWQRLKSGLTYEQLIGMLPQRFREQAWRYHIIDEVDSEVLSTAHSGPRDLTYWIVRRSRDGRMMSVKIKFDDSNCPYMSEVVDLNMNVHTQGNTFVLPRSYTPWLEQQRVVGIEESVRGISFPKGYWLDFFNPRGVEMNDYPKEGEDYIPFDEIPFSSDVVIGDFDGMQSL